MRVADVGGEGEGPRERGLADPGCAADHRYLRSALLGPLRRRIQEAERIGPAEKSGASRFGGRNLKGHATEPRHDLCAGGPLPLHRPQKVPNKLPERPVRQVRRFQNLSRLALQLDHRRERALKRHAANQRFEEHHPHRIPVARGPGPALEGLGRHVEWAPRDAPGVGPGAVRRSNQAKIQDNHLTVRLYEEVRRLEVPMDPTHLVQRVDHCGEAREQGGGPREVRRHERGLQDRRPPGVG